MATDASLRGATMVRSIGFVGLLALAACSAPDHGFDAGAACARAADCDDGVACTTDLCLVGGVCSHATDDTRCPSGQTCAAVAGCVASTMHCAAAADCDDHVPCTLDACLVDGTCSHTPQPGMCPSGQSCTAAGCTAACASAADCDDHVDCTLDTCGVDGHCTHTAQSTRCPTGMSCNPTMGCLRASGCSTDADCSDHVFCNGVEHCSTELACTMGTAPDCDDGDACTIDACSEATAACTHAPNPMCAAGHPGTYDVAPEASYMCTDSFVGMVVVDLDVTYLQVSTTATSLTIVAGNSSSRGAPPSMTGALPAADGSFTVMAVRSGGCNESYTLTGRFVSATMVTAMLSVSFAGADCSFTNCMATSFSFSATLRM